MFREFIASTGLGGLHLVATVLFFVVFVVVVARALLGRDAGRRMAISARLPFEDGEPPEAGGPEGRET